MGNHPGLPGPRLRTVGISVGIAAAVNNFSNTIQAFVADSSVTGTSVAVAATSTATIDAVTIGGVLDATIGKGDGFQGDGAGARIPLLPRPPAGSALEVDADRPFEHRLHPPGDWDMGGMVSIGRQRRPVAEGRYDGVGVTLAILPEVLPCEQVDDLRDLPLEPGDRAHDLFHLSFSAFRSPAEQGHVNHHGRSSFRVRPPRARPG
ncbi:MAG TPA: hypothetical protein VJY33_09815 [Isosphaeraceae bacterium]|nr:hypothetical protein [Isosphaeraceae bacterium]